MAAECRRLSMRLLECFCLAPMPWTAEWLIIVHEQIARDPIMAECALSEEAGGLLGRWRCEVSSSVATQWLFIVAGRRCLLHRLVHGRAFRFRIEHTAREV